MASGLHELAEKDPGRLAVADGTLAFTRAEFNERVNRCGRLLATRAGEDGRSVAILAGNSADYLCVAVAAAVHGMPLVPVNWHLAVEEIAYLLDASGARLLVVDETHAALGADAVAKSSGQPALLSMGEGFAAALAEHSGEEPEQEPHYASPIYFTSGTTGRPKATRMSQAPNAVPVSTVIEKLKRSAVTSGVGEDTVHLTMGPLYHAGPLTSANSAAIVGGTVHVMPRFDAEEVLRWIDAHRINHTIMVPTHCVRLLRLPPEVRSRYDVSSMKSAMHIAAMMPVEIKRQMIEWWGPVLSEGYGASEVGVVSAISAQDWLRKPGSVGKPIPSFTIQIVGEDGEELGPGEIGTIYMTSLTDVDLSYENDPEKTAAAHRGPKQFTLGDLGWLDEDGYLFLADRRVDLIISGGSNIYPAEVESALILHPAVEDVGVFGIPDPEWGQQVKAAVQLGAGHEPSRELQDQLIRWLRERLAHYKVPKTIDFHDALPRFSNGKLHRRQLREPYWGEDGA